MKDDDVLSVKVWGPWACFTRPEMKVERVSYDVMTPSAARGVLEAILWKPQFKWRIKRIEVLSPIRRFSLLRNEVKKKASKRSAFDNPFYADDNRTQRNTLALRDVSYIIRASFELTSAGQGEHPEKYRAMFRRRVGKGQCFHRPYLGCREFGAHFSPPDGSEKPIDLTTDLGRTLFDIQYRGGKQERGKPLFFNARIDDGIVTVPPDMYAKLEEE